MSGLKFRNLTAAEIECRVAMVNEKGCSLLLYKDARCDMNILDEEVGAENWQREHYECKGNLFCRVGINVNFEHPENGEKWIWKSDCGAESYTEKEKGEASDSFKRACFNWGIGRELYTAPFIWVKADDCRIVEKSGKYTVNDKFSVEKIIIEDKKIIELSIRNNTQGKIVYNYPQAFKAPDTSEKKSIKCSKCNKEIKSSVSKTGEFWGSNQIIELSKKNFGEPLCADCMRAKNAK